MATQRLSGASSRISGATTSESGVANRKHRTRAAIAATCHAIPLEAPRIVVYARTASMQTSYHISVASLQARGLGPPGDQGRQEKLTTQSPVEYSRSRENEESR